MKGSDSTIQTHLLDNIYNQYKIEKGSLYCADFQQLNEDSLNMPEYARVCQSMLEYARICQSMSEYARVCQSMPEYARVC